VRVGSTGALTLNGVGVTVTALIVDADCEGLLLSATVTVNDEPPLTVGTPEMVPAEFRMRPGASCPEVIDHLYGAVPPLTCNVWLYAVPTITEGSTEAAIVNGGAATKIVMEAELACPGLLLSFTIAVNIAAPLTLGTPEIVPVEELSASPAGRLPEAIDHL
jgi:hypothetical protein